LYFCQVEQILLSNFTAKIYILQRYVIIIICTFLQVTPAIN